MQVYQLGTYDDHLKQMQFVQVEGGQMAYLDFGEGQPILLVHGVPNSSWLYRKMINPLVEAGFRVIVPDLLGYGASDKPSDDQVYAAKLQGDRILALMAFLDHHQWLHVCHDAGGPWTWELMLKEPARISHLIILNTIVYQKGFNPPFKRPHGSPFVRAFTWLYCSKLIAPIVMNAFWSAALNETKLTKTEKQGYLRPLVDRGHHALRYFFSDFYYFEQLLGRIHELFRLWTKPVLVIWGKCDKTLSAEDQIPQLQMDFIKSEPEIHIIKDASHLVQEEKPVDISLKIKDFYMKN